jgi:PAS domain-containing protein
LDWEYGIGLDGAFLSDSDDQGEFLGYHASNRDITERKKAEAALAESSIRRK